MQESKGVTRTLAFGAGFGLGLVWIVLAIASLVSASRGFANDRLDWGVGWGLVGILLLAAGTSSIVATWWHTNRVVNRVNHHDH